MTKDPSEWDWLDAVTEQKEDGSDHSKRVFDDQSIYRSTFVGRKGQWEEIRCRLGEQEHIAVGDGQIVFVEVDPQDGLKTKLVLRGEKAISRSGVPYAIYIAAGTRMYCVVKEGSVSTPVTSYQSKLLNILQELTEEELLALAAPH